MSITQLINKFDEAILIKKLADENTIKKDTDKQQFLRMVNTNPMAKRLMG